MIKVFILQLIVNKTSIKSIGGNVLWYTIKLAKLQYFFVENGSRFQCHPYLVVRVTHFESMDKKILSEDILSKPNTTDACRSMKNI